MPHPKAAIKKLWWWLQKRFENPFRELGDQLVHGKQEDGTECGILAVNTIAHKVFQDPLWVVGRKAVERVVWFNKLVGAHIQEVRITELQYLTIDGAIPTRSTVTPQWHHMGPQNHLPAQPPPPRWRSSLILKMWLLILLPQCHPVNPCLPWK